MTQIAFILLCHKDPDGVIAQTLRLTAAGDCVAIHFDGRAATADFNRIRAALAGNRQVTFTRRRIRCGWGEWSLVAATLEGLKAAVEAFPGATHVYMLSGDCMPIKTAEYIRGRLEREDVDYIESFDFFGSDWIKTGIKEERLIYRLWFNERKRKARFYRSMACAAAPSRRCWTLPPGARMSPASSRRPGFRTRPSSRHLSRIWCRTAKSARGR